MSRALYQDIYLSAEQIARVREYVVEVDFHLPGTTARDFEVNPRARYLGYMFQKEDLESYGVGLQCTAPGMEHQRTFIRVSRGFLLGDVSADSLPVNPPVLAAEAMTLHRFYEREGAELRHGVDTYVGDEGLAGGDMDLDMLEQQLKDIVAFDQGAPVPGNQEILDLKIFWGSLLAGRYLRLAHFERAGGLSAAQAQRLERFRSSVNAYEEVLDSLGLATLKTLQTTPKRDG